MTNDLNQSLYVEDEIDLKEVVNILLESKKLIISTVLIFTIASIIYSFSLKPSFATSAKLEIGYTEMISGDIKLIESTSDVISNFNILVMKNHGTFDQNISINSFENKIISFETTSKSLEKNEKLLNEVITYIKKRHSNLELLSINQKKDDMFLDIDTFKSQISSFKESMQFNLEAEISKLQNDIPIIDQEINQLNQIIIEDSYNLNLVKDDTYSVEKVASPPTLEQIISSHKSKINQLARERNNAISNISILSQKLNALKKGTLQSEQLFNLEQSLKNTENKLKILTNQTQVKTKIIGNIETSTIKPKTGLVILLSILFGFITSVLLVFINNFLKSFRESDS
jgi:LPS O-antigen subunit length determinant protein (WzzB/FepE family)